MATVISTSQVRAWAQANGFDVGDRGRLPAEVHDAYDKAHGRALDVVATAETGAPTDNKAVPVTKAAANKPAPAKRTEPAGEAAPVAEGTKPDTAVPAKTSPPSTGTTTRTASVRTVAPRGRDAKSQSTPGAVTEPPQTPGSVDLLRRVTRLEEQVAALTARLDARPEDANGGRRRFSRRKS